MSGRSLRFSHDEFQSRLKKVQSEMQVKGLDVLIVSDPANMAWITGYDGWSFYVFQSVIVPVDDDPIWYGRGIDAKGASLTTWLSDDRIFNYPDHSVQSDERHPADFLCAKLFELDLASKTIGVEMDSYYFTAKTFAALKDGLPDATFQDVSRLVNWKRAIKTETELNYMRNAGRNLEVMYERVMEVAEPGMRKNDLVAEIYQAGISGAEGIYGDYPAIVPLLGSGEESAACHITWDDTPIEKDTGMFMELAGAYHRYHCPGSRTIYFGEPTDAYRRIEGVILEAIDNALSMFRPGNTCADVANSFFKLIRQNGYEKDNRCGYPTGLAYPPDWGEHTMSLRPTDQTVLQPGMTFHFMPGLWFEDWGFEITETILVTENGGECLSNVPRHLFVK